LAIPVPASAYVVQYKEEFYKLYHVHYSQAPDDTIENIYWLEPRRRGGFLQSLYALGKIDNEKDWEKYRYLFMMHVNLKLVEQHLRLGHKCTSRSPIFITPMESANLDSIKTAEICYKTGLYYWNEAKIGRKGKYQGIPVPVLDDLQSWEDERERIATGDLNYDGRFPRTRPPRQGSGDLLAMDQNTY
jgi:hypothetical protein